MKTMCVLMGLAIHASAALKWSEMDLALKVGPTQTHADAVFAYTNTGEEPIEIASAKPTCGCLAPKWSKRPIEPGTSGELTVRFDLRGREGPQRKAVHVNTSDGRRVELEIITDIPRGYAIAPVMMRWTPDNATPRKTARLLNESDQPIRLLSATATNKELRVELREIREGFEYEVLVERPPAGKSTRAVVHLRAEPPPGATTAKTFKFFVHAQ